MCREYQRYGSFLGLNNEAKNVAEAQAQLKARGDFTGKLSDKDIEAARKEGTPADGYACRPCVSLKLFWNAGWRRPLAAGCDQCTGSTWGPATWL